MEQVKKGRRRALGALLVTVALAAAACGSDGADEASGATDDGGGGDCGQTLTYGVVVPLSGELGAEGEDWVRAFELAFEEVEESGALPEGWKIDHVVEDDRTDPEEALRIAQKVTSSDSVDVILGPTSGPMVALHDFAEENEIPVISESSGTVTLNRIGGEWLYRTVNSDMAGGFAAAQWLGDEGVKTIGMLVQNEESPKSEADALKGNYDGEVVAEETFNSGQPSYQAQIQSVLDSDPEVVYITGGQESGSTILKELKQLGYEGRRLLSSDMVANEVVNAIGPEVMEGAWGVKSSADTSRDQYKTFAEAYTARYDLEEGFFAANAYDAAMIATLAAVAADSTCGADINSKIFDVANPDGEQVSDFAEAAELLKNGEEIDWDGASGPVDLDESGTAAGAYSIAEVQDGRFEELKFYPAETFEQFLSGS